MRSLALFFFLALPFQLFLTTPAEAQPELMLNHLTTEQGLSSNNIRAFVQDYQDFIWIGTENGLQRYDGYEFKLYQKKEGDSTSISGNFILSLFEDSRNNLWIGTLDGSLSMYHRELDIFYNFHYDPNNLNTITGNTIHDFYETDDGVLWLCTEQGVISHIDLNEFDPEAPVFHNIRIPDRFLDQGILLVSGIAAKNSLEFWITIQGGGLWVYNSEEKTFYDPLVSCSNPVEYDRRITALYKDSSARLWLSSWGSGIYLYDSTQCQLIEYSHRPGDDSSLPNNLVVSMIEDHSGKFWVGSDNGLCQMLDFQVGIPKGEFQVYQYDPFYEHGVSANSIKGLYEDNQHRLWISAYYGGANVYDPDYFRFKTIRSHPLYEHALPGDNITAVVEDSSGTIWIGTDNNGLCYIENGTGNLENHHYQQVRLINSLTGIEEQKIKALNVDSKGKIWIGTWGGGLFCHDPGNGQTVHYSYHRPNTLPSESILAIEVDSLDNIWIGTFNGGLTYLDTKTNEYTYYRFALDDDASLANNRINTLLLDKEGILWVGTEGGGTNRYVESTESFQRINKGRLRDDLNIISLYQCHDGYIWVGTHSEGLFRYDPESGDLSQYTTEFGIAGNLIQSILEDQNHYLWVSTNNGISKFVFSQNSVTNYSVEEGLQSRQFNPNCAELCDNGLMILGGINGFNAFFPENIEKSEYIPNLVFTHFWINNQEANIGDKNSPLLHNINVAEKIDLRHDKNSFSIEYAALEYDFANRTEYVTFLENYDEQWQNRGSERKITYTNMPPDEYVFRVKAINKDGFTADRDKTLSITIHPAWYQTRLFQISLLLLVLGITYTLVQVRLNFLKKQNALLEKMVHLRTRELSEKSNEILAQNEELQSQNEQISLQREELEITQDQLKELNSNLENMVEERTNELQKTISELDRFVYSASHDLSAPLKSVLGLLNIAKIDRKQGRTDEYLEYIENSILKLEEVIRSLISYSRNSRLDVNKESFNLIELVQNVIEELAFLSTDKKINFEVDVDKDASLYSDRQRVNIILHNLINNAIKYADPEKTESLVRIAFEYQGNEAVITITDNGIGIEKKQIKKVFNMFYRASEKSSGSGLGLYIVQETLNTLDGKIVAKSKPGVGTEFTVKLPLP
jgi:signal transduction histidine kinase/ligand-binding sensor domain-containing protein